ncbi:DUF805 domain-containing protein [Demequina rhizosphaerae]|uniref:DUF805 domain-containing protein n=1 Tax=Demequina rhizosphaerae TaxID=1638985 RepID=UPI000780A6E6|nr:DUF805 domain-containing protein [Demequina rhizosphaerae]
MDGYKLALSKYAQFSDRSRRREYWGFVLVNVLIALVLNLLIFTLGYNADDASYTAIGYVLLAVFFVYALAILLPSLALQWRRYQDIGWPGAVSIIGWFLPLLTFIVALIPGNQGPNQYGPDPKA